MKTISNKIFNAAHGNNETILDLCLSENTAVEFLENATVFYFVDRSSIILGIN